MDFVNKFTGGSQSQSQGANEQQMGQGQGQQGQQQQGGGGFLGGITNKLNTAAGGGRESEKNEDMLDKGSSSNPASFSYTAR